MRDFLECFPWEPDDKGGGFACIEVNAEIYEEKEIDTLIKQLLNKRRWLRKQLKRACMDSEG